VNARFAGRWTVAKTYAQAVVHYAQQPPGGLTARLTSGVGVCTEFEPFDPRRWGRGVPRP
jgi:hypothetical protein